MEKALRTAARPNRAPLAAVLGAFVSAALIGPTPAKAQGFFDFLFGGGRPSYYDQRPAYDQRPVVAYAPDPGYDLRDQPRPIRRAKPKTLDDLVYTGKPEKKPPPPVGDGPLGAFLNDPTLREGDVVVTAQGLMVYRGGGGSVHRDKDFVGLAQARSLAGSERNVLASIEKANRSAPRIQAVADVQPAVDEPVKQASNDTPRRRRH